MVKIADGLDVLMHDLVADENALDIRCIASLIHKCDTAGLLAIATAGRIEYERAAIKRLKKTLLKLVGTSLSLHRTVSVRFEADGGFRCLHFPKSQAV